MLLFLKLLLAHLLGDFLLQPYTWVKNKNKKKIASGKLYLHILIHFLLAFLFVWDLNLWYIPIIIAVSHYCIDLAKLYLQSPTTKRLWFFTDQFLHFLVILILSFITLGWENLPVLPDSIWVYLTGLFLVTFPAAISIKTLISVYSPKTELKKDESLDKAGSYIGILERVLVFVFIVTNHWEGVGFLIAAKSIFRFSDLTQSKDRKLTEYILIGTLVSFSYAIFSALACIFILTYI